MLQSIYRKSNSTLYLSTSKNSVFPCRFYAVYDKYTAELYRNSKGIGMEMTKSQLTRAFRVMTNE